MNTDSPYRAALLAARAPDGGFGLVDASPSEVEPTAVAALALGDPAAKGWLVKAQRPNGGFGARDGRPESPSVAALAALAIRDHSASSKAMGYVLANRAPTVGESGNEDGDGRNGWGWTNDSYSWVEPTSRVLMVMNALRPTEVGARAEAVEILRQRHCRDGGWNYGSNSAKGVDLRGYAQTTAVALMALQGGPFELVEPGLRFLKLRWRDEPGGLTLAQTALAFDLHGEREGDAVRDALETAFHRTAFMGNVLALGWATLATSPVSLWGRLRRSG